MAWQLFQLQLLMFKKICSWICSPPSLPRGLYLASFFGLQRQMLNLKMSESVQLTSAGQEEHSALTIDFFFSKGLHKSACWRAELTKLGFLVPLCLRVGLTDTKASSSFSATEASVASFSCMKLKRVKLMFNAFLSKSTGWGFVCLFCQIFSQNSGISHRYLCPLLSWPISATGLYSDSRRAHASLSWAGPWAWFSWKVWVKNDVDCFSEK